MSESVMLSKEQIFAAPDIQFERVEVPEWGGHVFVKSLTAKERDAFEASIIEQRGRSQRINFSNMRAKLCVRTVCDASGARLFTEGELDKLAEKSAGALQRLFDVAVRLSGLKESDIDELVGDLKNENPDASPTA